MLPYENKNPVFSKVRLVLFFDAWPLLGLVASSATGAGNMWMIEVESKSLPCDVQMMPSLTILHLFFMSVQMSTLLSLR